MPDFIKFAIYGSFAPKDYNPDDYIVDEEDRKGKKKDKNATDKDDRSSVKSFETSETTVEKDGKTTIRKDKDATDDDDRSSVESFETSGSTIVEKDGKITTRHQEKETTDSSKAPEISEGSSRSKSKSKSKPKRRLKLHDAGPSGAKGVFNSMFGNHGYGDGYASLKW